MGGLLSKSRKPATPADPRWQGVGPNTPLPSSLDMNHRQQPRSNTLTTLDSTARGGGTGAPGGPSVTMSPSATTASARQKAQKSSKIMLLLKLDPKGGGKRKVVISKNLISLPSDFRHTGHIGAGEVRSGQIDPEKIKNQMMEVAACLRLDSNAPLPSLKTIPVLAEGRDDVYTAPNTERYAVRPGAIQAH